MFCAGSGQKMGALNNLLPGLGIILYREGGNDDSDGSEMGK